MTENSTRVSPSFLAMQEAMNAPHTHTPAEDGGRYAPAPQAPAPPTPLSEQMAAISTPDQATTGEKKVTRPEGAPGCWPFQRLPRSQKAVWMEGMGPVLEAASALEDLDEAAVDGGDDAEQMALMGRVYRMLGGMEDLLVACAVEPKKMVSWCQETASDEDIVALFSWYVERFQPGEQQA